MFQRIIVPLDGSERAEQALPVAARIAHAVSGSIVLLQVVQPPNEYDIYSVQPTIVTREEAEANIIKATAYLTSVTRADDLEGIGVQIKVLTGTVAPTICSFAQSTAADLIVICSHGYTGFKRWTLGSVADIVARTAPIPVFVLRDGGPTPAEMFPDGHSLRALITLDGSRLAETVLEPAAQLVAALATQGHLHLVYVVDIPATNGVGKSSAYIGREMIESAKETAQAYLISIMDQLQKGTAANLNLTLTSSVISSADIAGTIIQESKSREDEYGYGLIAMSTHGRGGLARWLMGSITERVLHSTKLPLFIVRPQQIPVKKEANHKQSIVFEGAKSEEQSWVGLL